MRPVRATTPSRGAGSRISTSRPRIRRRTRRPILAAAVEPRPILSRRPSGRARMEPGQASVIPHENVSDLRAARRTMRAEFVPHGGMDMADTGLAEPLRTIGSQEIARIIERAGEHLPAPERAEAFGAYFDEFAGAKVMLLGEATHGTSEFYRARAGRRRYACVTPWQARPASYGRAALSGRDTCEDEAVEQLRELLEHHLEYLGRDGEDFFDAAQNARIVRAAEQYYRVMYRGAADSWNLRDRHMFETLQRLSARRPCAKAVVWAHNSHIGNAAATAMGWEGEFNIGELCRTAHGRDAALIGFGTDRGTVTAARDWDGPMEIRTVL